ncbi:MAG: DUF975 family protein [Candidatus Faecimonas sp.]|nr:DUF975 family protein [Mycoplasmatota bacterium]MDY2908540.1 DUF975 family protein [Candidatus Faecimonas sp.]
MKSRKELKKNARNNLKKHYLIFIVTCVIAAFIGTEFTSSFSIVENKILPESIISEQQKVDQAVKDALKGETAKSKKATKKIKEEIIEKDKKNQDKVFGRSRGVFAMIINAFSTGTIYVNFIAGMNSIIGHPNITSVILIGCSLLVSFLIWMFFINMYQALSRRIFLEGRIYKRVPMQRFLFLLRTKTWLRTSWTMFVTSAFYSLWCLTIVGIVIKRYSYMLVPYIIAENPKIKTLDAINLSRKMMDGHKWECFKLELSYIGWIILGTVTFGITEVLYSNPYRVAALTEYYVSLRKLAKKQEMPGIEKLNDVYLYETAPQNVLEEEYKDVINALNKSKSNLEKPKGLKRILADCFGISLADTKEKEKEEQEEIKQERLEIYKNIIQGKEYPMRLFTISEKHQRKRLDTLNYTRRYSIWSLIAIFFTAAIIGWLFEVTLHIIEQGEFVKRGVLQGPWLPIYGYGCILILTVLYKFRKKPVKEFFLIIILCGIVEYCTGVYLEHTFNGTRWWDYSGYFLNIHGRVCAEGLLVFGLGGIILVYMLAPLIDNLLKRVNPKKLIVICCILLSLFIFDHIYSHYYPNEGKGITDIELIVKGR